MSIDIRTVRQRENAPAFSNASPIGDAQVPIGDAQVPIGDAQ